jgi:integrase
MRYQDVPAFLRTLGNDPAARFMRFYILTAAGPRLAPYQSATWSQIDDTAMTWTVPGELTKSGRRAANKGQTPEPFVIPLSTAAREALGPRGRPGDLLFAGPNGGRITVAMSDFGVDFDAHGMRGSFSTWVDDLPDGAAWYPVAQACLHHGAYSRLPTNGGRVGEQSSTYRKSNVLPKRRELLERWAGFLTGQ